MADDVRFDQGGLLPVLVGLVPLALLAVLVAWARRGRGRTLRALLSTAVAGVLALELTCNERLYTMLPQFWLLELALVGGLVAVLWLLCGRRGWGPVFGLVALYAVGLVQHYVLEFRGTSVLPSDIFALGTALSVSGGYTYGVSGGMVEGLMALALGVCSAHLLSVARRHAPHRSCGRNLAWAALVAAGTVALVALPYGPVFGADLDYWWSRDWYGRQGFLPSSVYAWQDLAIAAPDGYTPEAAEKAEQSLAARFLADEDAQAWRTAATGQFGATPPNVIVIQNETFCDLSAFAGLDNGYTGPTFWNDGLADALARGSFAVSVFGGGTCNTEFEFLTGNSLAFVGTAKYPFTMYDLDGVASLPRQLGALGYRTVGMHPNLASNWNRDRAYEQLGFDEFLSIDDFAGAEEFHEHVSDWATYKRALDLIAKSDEPVLVFDVTMQNHSGYDTGSVPSDMLPGYTIAGLSDEDTFELNEYLACIEESDRALERLVGQLRALGEPTVVVMYGDHHPWFSQAINDLLFPDEDELAHAERIHQTAYVAWANYPVAGADKGSRAPGLMDGDTSADLLASMVLGAVGAPLSDYQAAQLGARQDVRAINADGVLDADGVWRALGKPGDCAETVRDLRLVAYRNFGEQV